MWYRFVATIPANTPMATPYRREFRVPGGVIHRIRMRYPPGPWGMVYSAVFLGGAQIFPTEPGDYFHGNDEHVEGDTYVVTKKGWHWAIEGYSPGTRFEHEVHVDLFVLAEDKASPWRILGDFVEIVKKLIGL